MRKRSKSQQQKHDRKVRSEAKKYQKSGWNVKADVKGYKKPSKIGKHRRIPDIEATKRGTRHIVEVETKDTINSDKAQRSTFRRSAAKRRRTKYIEKRA